MKKIFLFLLFILILSCQRLVRDNVSDGSRAHLVIMSTTDLHANALNYDYFKDAPSEKIGLSKLVTIIKEIRSKKTNTLLVDNGDTFQGTPLGDYFSKIENLDNGHPMVKAMNAAGYDVINLGNHDFNYGLDFITYIIEKLDAYVVSANVYKPSGENYFTPYVILKKEITTESGTKGIVNIGVFGLVPPRILVWDKLNLEGKLKVKSTVNEAKKYAALLKRKGVDIVVMLNHGGISLDKDAEENTSYLIARDVDDIDVIITGHSHLKFPFPKKPYYEGEDIDNDKGTLFSKPTVMAASLGKYLGVIDLDLRKEKGIWVVDKGTSKIEEGKDYEADSEILNILAKDDKLVKAYIRKPIGTISDDVNSYFALVRDDPSIQIINDAQKWYAKKHLKGTEYEGIEIISAAAPFKSGGRMGADYYTVIEKGSIAVKNTADLYLYPNTIIALKVSGAELKEMLEWAAHIFNQIDPNVTKEQNVINEKAPAYNFDVIDGLEYEIDVTQPAKYDRRQNLLNKNANRIKNIRKSDGTPLKDNDVFILITNNYRASTNRIINKDGKNILIEFPDENRQALINYIIEQKNINTKINNNWKIATLPKSTNIVFRTSTKAKTYAKNIDSISFVRNDKDGYGIFRLQ